MDVHNKRHIICNRLHYCQLYYFYGLRLGLGLDIIIIITKVNIDNVIGMM